MASQVVELGSTPSGATNFVYDKATGVIIRPINRGDPV